MLKMLSQISVILELNNFSNFVTVSKKGDIL